MRKTALHDVHEAMGARMVEFGGWHMPLSYTDIVTEHRAVRTAAGLFDLGHMGRLHLDGPDRLALMERTCSNRIADMQPGDARYGVLTDERGNAVDDIITYCFADHLFVVVNAANREKDLAWLQEKERSFGLRAGLEDRSEALAMLALQGPLSEAILAPVSEGLDFTDLGYYKAGYGKVLGVDAMVAFTGYTGELGYELYFDRAAAERVWRGLLERGAPLGLVPVGLGARDTLRLEAAMPLYGHELSDQINPLEAGLGFAVKTKDRDFIGREALARVRKEKPARKLVCIVGGGRRIPRPEHPVMREGRQVGVVTSGSFSPTLEKPIALALVEAQSAEVGAQVTIDVRGKALEAEIVGRPFYKRSE